MNRTGSKDQSGRGWLAAGIAGLSLGMAVVTARDVSGNEQLAMAGSALVSLAVALGGARMEASQNRKFNGARMGASKDGKFSVGTLLLVALMIVVGAGIPLRLEGIEWPPALVIGVTVLAVLAIAVAAFLGRKSKKSKSNFNNWRY